MPNLNGGTSDGWEIGTPPPLFSSYTDDGTTYTYTGGHTLGTSNDYESNLTDYTWSSVDYTVVINEYLKEEKTKEQQMSLVERYQKKKTKIYGITKFLDKIKGGL